MQFVMFVCAEEGLRLTPEEASPEAWLAEVERRGVRLEGDRLQSPGDATTVRESGRLITDGPFAETREQIGGYDLLECADLDEAIEIASKHPMAKFGAIELRPVWTR
jgi:hypothetical protein